MTKNFADKLCKAIRDKHTPACVGLDPQFAKLPAKVIERASEKGGNEATTEVAAVSEFSRQVIDTVASLVPVVKINIAFFEKYHWRGVKTYFDLVGHAHHRGLLVIGDVKRADIGHSAAMYAAGQLANPPSGDIDENQLPDAITVNPYFGIDGVEPFINAARDSQKGLFVLVHTSNPSAAQVQGLRLDGGASVAEEIAAMVNEWSHADGLTGEWGYSSIGAVVAPGDRETAQHLRELIPNSIFLVPGFGAQGRGAHDVAPCFNRDRLGAVVNASRSVIDAHQHEKYRRAHGDDWNKCVEHACRDFIHELDDVTHA